MTDKNNTKHNAFGVVIEPQKESANPYYELAQLQNSLLGHREFFVATIIHDKDKDSDNLPKRTHLHAFLEFNEKYTKKQLLATLSGLLSIDPIRISIQPTNNSILLVQYLTHKNDPNKTQYGLDQVKSNNADILSQKYDKQYLSSDQKKDQLELDIKQCKTLLDFMTVQGLETANKYRATFNQIKQEQHLDLDTFSRTMEKLELFIDWLEERKRILAENKESERLNEFLLIYGEIKTRFREFFKYRN